VVLYNMSVAGVRVVEFGFKRRALDCCVCLEGPDGGLCGNVRAEGALRRL